ncbi:MGDG synthase family glycosyltransferase [Geminisphaera colitermitum]|uniref:MGDG synthase family glycosyltransferase n=1 Tax=Geminisphaera colitermitum TaxID=1148786 RepID=UPI000158CC35|nr:galactosyldiacylglycerol synthase [Geminisphaera colitermitum]
MKRPILIFTAGFGEGHNAAARALAQAFDAAHGAGTARVVDVFALSHPRWNARIRRAYLGAINGTPCLWNALYGWMHRSTLLPRLLRGRAMSAGRRLIAETIARERPAALCSTYPVYAYLVEKITAAGWLGVPPHFNVVTDSISINSIWWRADAGCAGWFVPNEDSAAVMREAGVDERRLHVTGFPVGPFFAEHEKLLSLPDPAGVAGCAPRVLYIINSGSRGAEETARRLLAESDWEVTITVGNDEALRRRLTRLALEARGAGRERAANILGWSDEMPRMLMTHHAVVSKAGGATTQEALAARCPMIVNQIVPGQEEGNYELLRRHGIGALAATPGAVVDGLRRAFADDAKIWRQWRAAIEPLARPRAAQDIAARVLAHVAATSAGSPAPVRESVASFLSSSEP